ncbi:DUF4328 domain-containing protein [Streptomyces sp. NPDC102462]|uniref:DUF4328 domain-containing protein n=1 Tax=Streptomyces sp. NPDC102462 TaxID=3366178 RepID=UPI003812FB99
MGELVRKDAPVNEEIAQRPALRPARSTALLATALLLLAGAAWLARAVWEIRLAAAGEPASGPPDQGDGNHRPLTSLEDAYHIVGAVGDVIVVFCAAAFLAWLWQVRDNARALSGRPPKYRGFWVYLGWIVPVANLWVPRGVVADVHRTSAPDKRLPFVLNVWWALWLIGMLSGVGLLYRESRDGLIERAYTDVWQLLLPDAAVVGAAVAAVFVVRAVTAAQSERTAAEQV